MPTLKTRCPECDTRIRRTVDEPGEYDLKCPDCGHKFSAALEDDDDQDRPTRYQPKSASKSNKPLIIGAVVGALLLLSAGVGLVLALSGGNKPVAQKDDAPAKAKAAPAPAPVKPKTDPPKVDPPKPTPEPEPQPNPEPPAMPPGDPGLPPNPGGPPVAPPRLPPSEDVFVRAATFKADGPLPELPPLPPAAQRPLLNLDPGGHTAFPKYVFFTPDADRVVSVGEDKSVRVWDVSSGEVLHTIRLPAGPDVEGIPQAAALSPDGKLLAVGVIPLGLGKNGIPFHLLAVDTGELIATIDGARNFIRSLAFSPDGKRVAVGSVVGTLQVYDLPSKKWVYQVLAHKDDVLAARFSPDGKKLATVGRDKDVKLWKLDDATNFAARIDVSKEGPNDAQWTADGNEIAVGCTSGELLFFDNTGKRGRVVPPAIEEGKGAIQITRFQFLPGDKQFVFGGVAALGWAGVTDIATGNRPVIVRDHSNTVMAVERSADGALAVTAGGDFNEILVWDVKTGTLVRRFQSASKGLWAVGWSKDGHSLAWGNTNLMDAEGLCAIERTLRLDDFQPGPAPKPADYIRRQLEDGALSISGIKFQHFTVSENGKPLYTHTARSARIYSVSFLPGKGIVVGASGVMYLLDAKTGNLIRDFRGDNGLTTALAPSPDGRYFVSGSSDHVIRVWSPDREEPVLSLFAVGREWIAWTPQGYYACSPFGERLIAWQMNRGLDKLPDIHPAARFRASLYQPELVKYLIPAGDMRLAMAMAVKFDKQQITATAVNEVLPPNVLLTAPPVADAKPVTISATAEGTAKNPIIAMRLLVDGRPFNGAAGIKKFDKVAKATAAWQVTLEPGPHTVSVLAESPVSKGMSATATVTRAGAVEKPNLYVLAMGVSAYPGNMKLNYAASDAILLSRTLNEKSRRVFGKIEMKVMTDAQVTKAGIGEGLDWLKSKMTAKDVGIVSFSGHGGKDDDTGKFYLIPVDVGRNLAKTCFSGEELKSRLEDMPGRIVAVLDACHSGAVTEIKQGRPDNLVRDLTTDDYGVVVLASSLGSEYSMESPTTKAGFYTLGLTEGMSGRADFNRDGVIHLNELEKYSTQRVQQLSQGGQNPTVGRPPSVKPFPIARP